MTGENTYALFPPMTAENKTGSDINALALEALDLWQEHIASYASDPKLKGELERLMQPMGQMFADWAALMQHAGHAATGADSQSKGNADAAAPAARDAPAAAAAGAASAAVTPDGGALKLAQLAHRMAALEQRLGELESRLAAEIAGTARAPRKRS